MSVVDAPRIAVVDYGMGNRRSVEKALERVGARPLLSGDHERLRAADGLVVPGVGAFPAAMESLRARGLDELLVERVAAGTPTLGLCLGMQLLFDYSAELRDTEGLGLLAGRVEALDARGLRLPHIGWNEVTWLRGSALSADLRNRSAFYHVHSYVARPADAECVLGVADYGERFATAVGHPRAPLFGVQFHPEKSSTHGLALLANFARVCVQAAERAA